VQRPHSDSGNFGQFLPIERFRSFKASPRPPQHSWQRFALRGLPIDRVAEIVPLAGQNTDRADIE
jgi:hypothetical protein